ncbi:hypothetical protein HJC23_002388 [Cyclotella cryptica]|uniref:Uncharacterized protein n=1 Tax=Cyclotella cryptica TaxID=29204 RepID=A0ABD3QLD6_9STRA|eukprot:CCRYP_004498-RA/>CCRYP_004498-RA protein AED:0.02 eAED:0.02 QI:311/1/1/1/1/1/2/205/407
MSASSPSISSGRHLKVDDGNGIICSSYTNVHVINFSYTVDTAKSDDDYIHSAIDQLESRSLTWLADKLLPCYGDRRLDWDWGSLGHLPDSAYQIVREPEAGTSVDSFDFPKRERVLKPDFSLELGLVGLKSWPDDIVSSISNCFPTYNKNDTCTVVFGTVSAYLNPTNSTDVVTETQKEEVEKNIRYQMMTLMRSGLLENELGALEHARYLSPIVVIDEKYYGNINSASQQYFQHSTDSSGMTVTQSLLIIAACVAVIGTIGLMLTVKVIFRDEEDFYSTVKQQQTSDESDIMIPQPSSLYERRRRGPAQLVDSEDAVASLAREDSTSNKKINNGQLAEQHQETTEQNNTSSSRGNDWGTAANMSTTMRRVIVTKKTPVIRARSGDAVNLDALIEEDEEAPQTREIE